MSELPEHPRRNRAFADVVRRGCLEIPPAKPVLAITCIDARLDPERMLGFEIGDATRSGTPAGG